jgi:hypothetical protein
MARSFILRIALGVGVLAGVLGVPGAGPADPAGRAEAGPRAILRTAARHQQHRLYVSGRHLKRNLRREAMQQANLKGTLRDLRGYLHPKRTKKK